MASSFFKKNLVSLKEIQDTTIWHIPEWCKNRLVFD
jgi:hypothetical protein